MADAGNRRVQVFHAADGEFAFEFGSYYLSRPESVAYSPSGDRIAVSDMRHENGNWTGRVLELRNQYSSLLVGYAAYFPGIDQVGFGFVRDAAYLPSGDHIAVANTRSSSGPISAFYTSGTFAFDLVGSGTGDGQVRGSPMSIDFVMPR